MANQRQVRIRVPHLRGGISRQPAHIRKNNQVEEASNVTFSIAEGASKRPGSAYQVVVSGLTASGNYRLHGIERDDDERFVVLYGRSGSNTVVKIWEVTAAGSLLASTVTIPTAVQTYLDSGSPTADDLRFSTFKDSTLIVNTKKATALTSSTDYAISASRPTFEILSSVTLNDGKFGKVRGSDGEDGEATYWRYLNTGDEEFGRIQFPTISSNANPTLDWTRPNGAWDEGTDSLGFKIAMAKLDMDLTACSWTTATKTLTKAGAFTNYSWDEDDQIYITGGTNVTAGWYTIASRDSDDALTLESEITTGSSDETDVTTDAIGREFEVAAEFGDADETWTMHDIAKRLEESLQNAGATNALVSWAFKGSNKQGRFTITGHWRGLGTKVFAPSAPGTGVTDISNASGEPFYSTGVTITEISSGTSQPTPDTLDPAARWTQIAPPGQASAMPDKTSMPVLMTLDTFTGDGATAATFSIAQIDWNARIAGDAELNPPPSILSEGLAISDATFHAGRLMLAGGEYVNFSQAGDLYNFWIEDPLNITDADPIDIPVSTGATVAQVEYLVNYRDTVVVFTKADRQAVLNTPDVLSPTTARFTPSTRDRKTPNVRPVVMGDLLYYTGPRADESILFENKVDELSLLHVSESVSKHVQGLLPTTIQSLTIDTNNRKVFITPTDCDHIFVYEPDWINQEKVQQAWTKWQFDDSYRISDTVSVNANLYMIIEDATQYMIEKVAAARQTLQ